MLITRILKWGLIIAALVILYIQLGGSAFFKKLGKGSIAVGEQAEKLEKKTEETYQGISKKVKKRTRKIQKDLSGDD